MSELLRKMAVPMLVVELRSAATIVRAGTGSTMRNEIADTIEEAARRIENTRAPVVGEGECRPAALSPRNCVVHGGGWRNTGMVGPCTFAPAVATQDAVGESASPRRIMERAEKLCNEMGSYAVASMNSKITDWSRLLWRICMDFYALTPPESPFVCHTCRRHSQTEQEHIGHACVVLPTPSQPTGGEREEAAKVCEHIATNHPFWDCPLSDEDSRLLRLAARSLRQTVDVTDEMVLRACEAFDSRLLNLWNEHGFKTKMRAALQAAMREG